jgi:hypothetical protein
MFECIDLIRIAHRLYTMHIHISNGVQASVVLSCKHDNEWQKET